MQLILVTGLSGSGKSIALDLLEDSGYYCVDNLPSVLLQEVVEYLQDSGYDHIAVSVDVRSHRTLAELPKQIAALRHVGFDARVLFLETKTDTLVRRFSETRRRHPLSDDRLTLPECIEREREMLSEVYGIAHRIDTSDLSPNTLRTWIKGFTDLDRSRLSLLFQSFGFKHGLPLDADLVFDVRCLPNPHWDPQLRPLTGRDAPVVAFLEADPEVHRMYDDIRRFVENWLPSFVRDNRNYLTVALGCTGGQHRSVYLAERLSREFAYHGQVLVRHRELAG